MYKQCTFEEVGSFNAQTVLEPSIILVFSKKIPIFAKTIQKTIGLFFNHPCNLYNQMIPNYFKVLVIVVFIKFV